MAATNRIGYSRQARIDLSITAVISIMVLLFAIIYDIGDALHDWLHLYEHYEFDEFFVLFAAFGLLASAFAGRRWRELQNELGRRIELEGQLQHVLMQSRGILQSFVQHTPSPVFVRDMQGRYLYANQSYGLWHGVDAQGLSNKTLEDIFPPAIVELIRQRDQYILEHQTQLKNEEEFTSNNHRITYQIERFPIFSESNELIGVGGIATDITELRATERALRDSERRFQLVVNSSKISVATHDTELRYTWVANPILPIATSNMLGRTDAELFDREVSERLRTFKAQVLRSGIGQTLEIPLHINGEQRSYEWRVEPLFQEDHTIIGIQCAAIDQTTRRELERQLEQARKLESIGRIAGGVAHDFNNLLTVIQGGIELAREASQSNPAALEELTVVDQATQMATGLTRRLLTFARKVPFRYQLVALNEWLLNQERLLTHLAGARIELRIEVPPTPCMAAIDAVQFGQVLLNLTMNAREAMPHGGIITIRLTNPSAAQPNFCQLDVQDNGIGMDAIVLSRLFEPFYSTKDRSSGLGLAVCHGIIQEHNGTITVASQPTIGTTFTILLPIATPPAVPEHPRQN
jgi:two-component system, cell cycle sensor histidine kinase and response regulator CckA